MKHIIPFITQKQNDGTLEWLTALRADLPDEVIVPFDDLTKAEREQVDVAIVANPDPAHLEMLPNLKWVQSLWAGVERLLAEMPKKNVEIVRMADPQLSLNMAEAVLAWTLYLHRDMPRYARQQEQRIWVEHPLPLASQRNVSILGLGKLGQLAAENLLGQGFNVLGWSRSQADIEGVETFSGPQGLTEMLTKTDILIVLLPLTNETENILNHEELSKLPKDASVINFARGPIINEAALLSLLDEGHLKHAVLDVFIEEPLPRNSVLWSHPKITVLPHISAPTTISTASKIVAQNIVDYRATGDLPETVDRTRGY